MSAENVELVRSLQPTDVDLVELFGGEATATALTAGNNPGIVSPDAAIEFVAAEPGLSRPQYRGVEGLIEGWRDWLEGWDSYVLRVEELLDAGGQVVALVRIKARTTRDGVEVEHAPAAVWTIEDGTVVGLTFYLNREQALAAAGLVE
jgi:ketosteroid isomerase-like protein